MNIFKRGIEKLYVKVFPDRKDEHFIATHPIEPICIEKANITNIIGQVSIPEYQTERLNDEQVKRLVVRAMENQLINFVEIKDDKDYRRLETIYLGRLRVCEKSRYTDYY